MTSARPSPAARVRERLAEAESDLARNRNEARWLVRFAIALPLAGLAAGALLSFGFGRDAWALVGIIGTLATSVVTFATGAYMIAVRRREFEDAIRDARATLVRLDAMAADSIAPESTTSESTTSESRTSESKTSESTASEFGIIDSAGRHSTGS